MTCFQISCFIGRQAQSARRSGRTMRGCIPPGSSPTVKGSEFRRAMPSFPGISSICRDRGPSAPMQYPAMDQNGKGRPFRRSGAARASGEGDPRVFPSAALGSCSGACDYNSNYKKCGKRVEGGALRSFVFCSKQKPAMIGRLASWAQIQKRRRRHHRAEFYAG